MLIKNLNSRNRKTLSDIFHTPVKSDIDWDDVERLVKALGGKIKNGAGSRRKLIIGASVGLFHEPHPGSIMDKGAVADLREWLDKIEVNP